MFKRFKISKKIVSGLLATALLIGSLPVYADGGGHGETGGGGSTGGGSSAGQVLYSSGFTGTKVSMIKVPVATASANYDEGYLFNKTAMGGAPGESKDPTAVDGSAPVYFMKKMETASSEGIASNGNYKTHSITSYVVSGTASNYGITDAGEAKAFDKVIKSFRQDWFGSLGDIIHDSSYLGIPQDMSKVTDETTKENVANIMKVMAKIVKKHYGSSLSGEFKAAIDRMAETGKYSTADGSYEYMFLIEPIVGVQVKGKATFGMTPNQFAELFLSSSGKSLTNSASMIATRDLVRNTSMYNSGSGFKNIINFMLGMWQGGTVSESWNDTGAQSVASKIFYTGPKEKPGNEIVYAKKSAKKYGWGVIKPSDLVQSSASKEVYYGTMNNYSKESGSSKYTVDGETTVNIINKASKNLGRDVNKVSQASRALDAKAYFSQAAIVDLSKASRSFGDSRKQLLFMNAGLRTAEFDAVPLPNARDLDGTARLDRDGFDGIIKQDEKSNVTVSPNGYMADMYTNKIDAVAGYVEGQIQYVGKGTETQGLTSYILDEALNRANLSLHNLRFNGKQPESGNPLVASRTDGSLAYGDGSIGAFSYHKINNVAIAKEVEYQYNKLFNTDTAVEGYLDSQRAMIKPSAYRNGLGGKLIMNNNELQNQDLSKIASLYNSSISNKLVKDASDLLITDGLLSSDQVFMSRKDGEDPNKTGSAAVRALLLDDGIELAIEVVTLKEDGTYEPMVFSNGTTSLPLDMVIPKNYTSTMTLGEKVEVEGKELEVNKVAIRSTQVEPESFIEELVKNLEAGNDRTTNKGGKVDFEVPIVDLDKQGNKEVTFSPRQEDTSSNTLGLVLIADKIDVKPTVVKVYEDEKGNHIKTVIEKPTNPMYEIKNEKDFNVSEWFPSKETPTPLTPNTPWEEISKLPPSGNGGTGPDTVDLSKLEKPGNVFIKFEKTENDRPEQIKPQQGEFVLAENRISNIFDLKKITKDNQLKDIVTSDKGFSPAFGSHKWYCSGCECSGHSHKSSCKSSCTSSHYCGGCYCPGHDCYDEGWEDDSYSLEFKIGTQPNTSAVAKNSGKYEFKYYNNKKSGSVEPYPVLKNTNSQQVAWRGKDKPVLAKYKSSLNSAALSDLAELGITQANTTGSRASGSYRDSTGTLGWRIDKAASDVILTKKCSAGEIHTTELTGELDYSGTILVQQYLGTANKGTTAVSKPEITTAKIGDITVKNVSNAVIKKPEVSYNPYVQMIYDTMNGVDKPAYVLAQHKSTFLPNDYMEMGWTNPVLESGKPSLLIKSKQWSTHRNATNGSEWRKANRVLPGGAMYTIEVAPGGNTKVGLASYLTYMEDSLISAAAEYNLSSLKLENKKTSHTTAVNKLKSELDKAGLQMMVNKNYSANFDANGAVSVKQGAKVTLDTAKNLSNTPKYWLQMDNAKKATSGDFEIVNAKSKATYYKVRSDHKGNVIIEKSVTSPNSGWNTVHTFDVSKSDSQIINGLNEELKRVNERTNLVSNFIKTIERGKGANGWYNEAWDGICVAVLEDTFELSLGQGASAVKKTIMDPKLVPLFQSQREMFTKAFGWGYKVTDTKVGVQFGNENLQLKNIQNMHKSDKFFIPNATVMDLD